MKKATLALFSLSLLLTATTSSAQNGKENDYEKYKYARQNSINKTYSASGNRLSIENSFGDVKFVASSGNEIKVNVNVEASSDNEAEAQRVFDAIKVNYKQDGSNIIYKTEIKSNDKDRNCKNCRSSFRISYEVHLPTSVPITVSNSFGTTILPDYKGPVSIVSQFGTLRTGDLQDVKKLEVSFGEAEVGDLANINTTIKFSNFKAKSLSGKNKLEFEFCGKVQLDLASSLESLDIKQSYSVVSLRPASNLSATYNIRSSFGKVQDRAKIGITQVGQPEKYNPAAKLEYQGKTGNGGTKINIQSEFGTIILGDAKSSDFAKDGGSKNKFNVNNHSSISNNPNGSRTVVVNNKDVI